MRDPLPSRSLGPGFWPRWVPESWVTYRHSNRQRDMRFPNRVVARLPNSALLDCSAPDQAHALFLNVRTAMALFSAVEAWHPGLSPGATPSVDGDHPRGGAVRGALSQEGDISLQEHAPHESWYVCTQYTSSSLSKLSCKAPEAHDEMRGSLTVFELESCDTGR